VVIGYRVKVLIPENEVWFNEATKRPPHVLRSMAGATIDYVITGIDREAGCCIASRRMALAIRRRAFLRTHPETGQKVAIHVLAVGRQHMLVTCGGFDMTLSPRDISYAMIPELRERYHPGEACTAVITGYIPGTESWRFPLRRLSLIPSTGSIRATPSAAAGRRSSPENTAAASSAGWRTISTAYAPILPNSTTRTFTSVIR